MKKTVLKELLAKRTKEVLEERIEAKAVAAKSVINTFNELPETITPVKIKKARKKKEDK